MISLSVDFFLHTKQASPTYITIPMQTKLRMPSITIETLYHLSESNSTGTAPWWCSLSTDIRIRGAGVNSLAASNPFSYCRKTLASKSIGPHRVSSVAVHGLSTTSLSVHIVQISQAPDFALKYSTYIWQCSLDLMSKCLPTAFTTNPKIAETKIWNSILYINEFSKWIQRGCYQSESGMKSKFYLYICIWILRHHFTSHCCSPTEFWGMNELVWLIFWLYVKIGAQCVTVDTFTQHGWLVVNHRPIVLLIIITATIAPH